MGAITAPCPKLGAEWGLEFREQGGRGAGGEGEQGSRGAGEQGSRGAGEQGSRGIVGSE